MDDALLAGRAASGDLDSFGQLYDRYFHRVYDFAWRTLSDPVDAAAATEEAFTRTAAALARPNGQAPTFRSMLFACAHAAVLARADAPASTRGGPAHEEAFGAFDVPDPAHLENASVVRGDFELASLAWEGLAGLTARDYALLDLHLREGLSPNEIAHVLGTNKKDAQTIITRMTGAATGVIDSYIIARRGVCPQLREALAPFAIPPFDDDARTIAQTHIASCDVCGAEQKRLPPMLDVLASFSPIAAPLALKGDLWRNVAATWRIAPATETSLMFEDEPYDEIPVSPYRPLPGAADGVPPTYVRTRALGDGDSEWTRNKVMVFAAAAIGLLLFAFAGGAVITGAIGGDDGGDDGAAAADPSPAGSPGVSTAEPGDTTSTPGVDLETPTQDPDSTPSPTPTEESDTATPEPAEDTPTPPPPPPTATPAPPSPTPPPVNPNPTPTRGALVPIGTPSG